MSKYGPSIPMLKKRREAKRRQLAQIGPIVQGSLVSVKHKHCKHVAHMLTFTVKGRTKSVYVPIDMVEEVKQWSRNFKQAKTLSKEISKLSLAIIHRYVPTKRAGVKSGTSRRPSP
jgi:hypothetical protein